MSTERRRHVQLKDRKGFNALTDREMQVLRLYPAFPFRKLIAHEMGIGTTTIRNHINSILYKLDCDALGQAAVLFDRWDRGVDSWPKERRWGERRQGDRRTGA